MPDTGRHSEDPGGERSGQLRCRMERFENEKISQHFPRCTETPSARQDPRHTGKVEGTAWTIQYSPSVTQAGETVQCVSGSESDSGQLFRLVLAVTLLINCSIR